jgi:hypothetical protein
MTTVETATNPVLENFAERQRQYQVAKAVAEKLEKSLKPAGYYNIPEILDKRRLEYGIPNGAFESYPTFDKVYLWQIALPEDTGETVSQGGRILKPEAVQIYQRNSAPRGIVVSAGLQAMDALYSTGIQIGHIVRFKKLSPFIMPVAEIDGKQFSVYVVRDGDIEASEDMAAALHAKRLQLKNISETGYDWRAVDPEGTVTGRKVSPYYDASV